MVKKNFMPNTKDRARSLQVVARCMRHLMQTAEYNLCVAEDRSSKLLQYEVWTARLNSDDDVQQFRSTAKEISKELVDMTVKQLTQAEEDLGLGAQTAESVHAGIGLYYFEDRDYREFGSDD